ncbi:MAG: SDR family NAD(P)-dependent oxidoreductase [Pseudomonas profundi]|uniref:SDR family NAD(P)-dependent oxidoreductase n=1 Tax=Pseudomonas profundi TaxID=1981513 RepID=UPI0030037A1B
MNMDTDRTNQLDDAPAFCRRYGDWALIAGASHGIGAAFARQVAAQGLNCILVARNETALESLKAELEAQHGIQALCVTQDLSAADATSRLLGAIGSRQVGLVIYNAGGDPFISQFLNTDAEHWMKLLRMNTQTVMDISHAFGGRMMEQGRGGLLLVGSHAALGGVRKLGMYSATKAFSLNLGESLWAEWKDRGVDVLNLLISTVDTPTMRETMQRLNIPNAMTMPLPQADDIARVALQELRNGPTFIHPEDLEVAAGAASPGNLRRDHVMKKSAEAAQFIGND